MNLGPGSGYTGYLKLGSRPGFIRVIKTLSGSGFFYFLVWVQPGLDYPGSSGSGPSPGYFATHIHNEIHQVENLLYRPPIIW